ncbi:hypothetical protein TSAR_002652, partial [Trichomalopsis sarcophagae]
LRSELLLPAIITLESILYIYDETIERSRVTEVTEVINIRCEESHINNTTINHMYNVYQKIVFYFSNKHSNAENKMHPTTTTRLATTFTSYPSPSHRKIFLLVFGPNHLPNSK